MKRLHVNYKNNQRKILYVSVFVVFLFMSVGYSVLKSDLSIKGKIKVVGYKEPILAVNGSNTTVVFNQTMDRSTVESIEFKDSSVVPDDAINSWDASAAKDSSVVAYILDEDNNDLYELYIIGRGGVKANPNSSNTFSNFINLESINFNNNYDTSNVTNMSYMFTKCLKLTELDLGSFNTSNLVNMSHMFSCATNAWETWNKMSLTNIIFGDFNTSKVTNMEALFAGCLNLTSSLDLSCFDTSNVSNMSYLFYGCSGFDQINLEFINTSNVTTMANMFAGCTGLTNIDLSLLDTTKVTSMASIFSNCSGLTSIDLSSLNTSNVVNMSGMFSNCIKLLDITFGNNFDTSNVVNMSSMFAANQNNTSARMQIENLNLNCFDTSKVTDMNHMFTGCSNLKYLNLSSFDTTNVKDMSYMFGTSYTFGAGITISELDISNFSIASVTDMTGMFCKSNISVLNIAGMDFSSELVVTNMFQNSFSSMNIIVKDEVAKTFIEGINSTANVIIQDL